MARKVSVDVAGAAKAAPIFVILCEGQPRIRVFVWNSGLCTSLLGQGIGERWFTPARSANRVFREGMRRGDRGSSLVSQVDRSCLILGWRPSLVGWRPSLVETKKKEKEERSIKQSI